MTGPALQCPECKHKHPVDDIPRGSRMFRCRECSRSLKVPQTVLAMRGEGQSSGPASGVGPGTSAGVARTGAPTVAIPRAEGPVASAAGHATITEAHEPAGRHAERHGMALPLRAAVWFVALGMGFVLAVVPLYLFGVFTSDHASNVLLEDGFDRIKGLLFLLPLWAAVTATLAHFAIESQSR